MTDGKDREFIEKLVPVIIIDIFVKKRIVMGLILTKPDFET